MIGVAEAAMEAVHDRDELAAQVQQQQLDHNELEGEGDNGDSSKARPPQEKPMLHGNRNGYVFA
jgi:hypothetical protein